MSAPQPRGTRLVCSLRSTDGAVATFDALPGEKPGSVAKVDSIEWSKQSGGNVQEGSFVLIGELGMTGKVINLNQYQWRALTTARLEQFFYGAILWGADHAKVIADAELILKRG